MSARRAITEEIIQIARDAMKEAGVEWVNRGKAKAALNIAERRKKALQPK